jgi:hypothetical protein
MHHHDHDHHYHHHQRFKTGERRHPRTDGGASGRRHHNVGEGPARAMGDGDEPGRLACW